MKKTALYSAHGRARQILLGLGACASPAALAQATNPFAQAHVALAIATSVLFVAAFLLALTLWLQTRRLHDLGRNISILDQLPPVLTLEKFLFRILAVGWLLLGVLVATGMGFGEYVWGHVLIFNHKVIFTLLAWLVFSILLIGRHVSGWRGLVAIRATIFGFALLFLAYVGTHFVLDIILKGKP